jgi:hypothetical protein
MTPIHTNPSRKRSRDDTAFEIGDDGSYFHQHEVKPPAAIPEEPIYGEGMVLINPSTGASLSADSQTGTWYEEKAEHEALKKEVEAANFRPKLPTSRKSMRLSQSSIRSGLEASSSSFVPSQPYDNAPASPPKTANSSSHPEIDDATMALGIGWTKISSDDAIQTAARGWARYLENHYTRHVHGAEILLQSNGLQAYLVGCQEGFYLFGENLLEGRLVSRTWQGCLQNLRSNPIVFDGETALQAERTPGPDAVDAGKLNAVEEKKVEAKNWAEYNRLQSQSGAWAVDGRADVHETAMDTEMA